MKKKKIVIKHKFRLLSIIFVLALLNMGLITYSVEDHVKADSETEYLTVFVEHNDTVWKIVDRHLDEIEINYRDIRDIVSMVVEVNDIENGIIVPGQSLLIPLKW